MNEFEKAKRWRETIRWRDRIGSTTREHVGLTVERLADMTGYSKESIYLFEKGFTYNGRTEKLGKIKTKPLDERVWHRYRMACAGVKAALAGSTFNW